MKKLFAILCTGALVGSAFAQGGVGFVPPTDTMRAQEAPDTLRAKPAMPKLKAPPPGDVSYDKAVESIDNQGEGRGQSGGRPNVKPDPQHSKPVQVGTADEAASFEQALAAEEDLEAQAIGGSRLSMQFTSTRVYPLQADATYPLSAIGKLYFRKPDGGSYVCSASVVSPGVVVTAGHCVHNGNGLRSGWYNSWTFIPGYRRYVSGARTYESRPFGTWNNPIYVRTSSDWFVGGGSIPNARDIALIVFGATSAGYQIGNYTGWLGWLYPGFIGRQITAVGYPVNLDGGLMMHRVEALSAAYGGYNNGVFGSDMTGGSSGGPIVMNLRADYTDSSAVAPLQNEGNRVVSVVSWGYTAPVHKVQGGSAFDAGFYNQLWQPTCAAVPSACRSSARTRAR